MTEEEAKRNQTYLIDAKAEINRLKQINANHQKLQEVKDKVIAELESEIRVLKNRKWYQRG
jgi:hypothetical protein